MPDQNHTPTVKDVSAEKAKRRGYFLINTAYYAFWIMVAIFVARYLFKWMVPFVLGFVVAALLQKPLRWLVKKTKISRKVFSVAMVVLVILALATLVAFIGWQLVRWVTGFFSAENIPLLRDGITAIITDVQTAIGRFSTSLPSEFASSIGNAFDAVSGKLIDLLSNGLSDIASGAVSLTTKFPSLLISFIMWILSSIFFTIDFDAVTSFFKRQIPPQHKALVGAVRDFCVQSLFAFGKAYALLMFITFVELSIGLSILRIPYAIPLAALIALIDILPVLGTGTVLIPWSIIALITGNFGMFIGVGLLYVIITVIRNILEPRIVSHEIGLHPLVTLFFMLLGLRAIGVIGMLLFPLIVIILKQLHDSKYIHLWN